MTLFIVSLTLHHFWTKVGEQQVIGPSIVQKRVEQWKCSRVQPYDSHDRQRNIVKRRKNLELQVSDRVHPKSGNFRDDLRFRC